MRRAFFAATLLLLATFALPRTAVHADAPILTGVRIEVPEQITVGDRVRYIFTLDAQAGTQIALATDSLPPFISLARTPELSSRSTGADRVELTLTVEVAPFSPGTLDVPPFELRYRDAAGAEGEIASPATQIEVLSVIDPAEDVAPRDLKPQAELGEAGSGLLWPVFGGLLVALVLLVALAVWRTRRLRRVIAVPEPVIEVLGPEDRARAVLDRAGDEFAAQADFEAYYATLAITVRLYLTERFGFPAFALTTRELQDAMVRGGVDRWQARIAGGLLEQCDAVVYAHYRPASERADADLTAAYEIVEMSRPEPEAEPELEEASV
ncbi:MAG TPA: hypothetical protein VJB57_09450 [Dehalococcoidia bacterium]|nr:hypothetical protein [Dehalococcoidia bacterium]